MNTHIIINILATIVEHRPGEVRIRHAVNSRYPKRCAERVTDTGERCRVRLEHQECLPFCLCVRRRVEVVCAELLASLVREVI